MCKNHLKIDFFESLNRNGLIICNKKNGLKNALNESRQLLTPIQFTDSNKDNYYVDIISLFKLYKMLADMLTVCYNEL